MKVYTNTENYIKDTLQTIPENCKIFPEFKPYPKWGQLHNATEQDLSNKKFVIFEKIHGTNTGCHIYFDEDGEVYILLSKRTSYLYGEENKQFYNIARTYSKYIPTLIECAKSACYEEGLDFRGKTVRFYGELYGGSYNKGKQEGTMKIQNGMDYAPGNHVAFFDCSIENTIVLSPEKLSHLLERYQLPMVPFIAVGDFDELNGIFNPNTFNSQVHKLHQKEIEEHGISILPSHKCEGGMLRPYEMGTNTEYCFKWKADEYLERGKKPQAKNNFKEDFNFLVSHMNHNRFDAYSSKHLPEYLDNPENTNRIISDIVQDVYEDINKLSKYNYILETKKGYGRIRRAISSKANFYLTQYRDFRRKTKLSPNERVIEIEKEYENTNENIIIMRKRLNTLIKRVEHIL